MASKGKRSAGAAARQRLVTAHQEEYRKLLAEEYAAWGLELEPTPEEKAEQKVTELLEKFPRLRDRFASEDQEPEVTEALDS